MSHNDSDKMSATGGAKAILKRAKRLLEKGNARGREHRKGSKNERGAGRKETRDAAGVPSSQVPRQGADGKEKAAAALGGRRRSYSSRSASYSSGSTSSRSSRYRSRSGSSSWRSRSGRRGYRGEGRYGRHGGRHGRRGRDGRHGRHSSYGSCSSSCSSRSSSSSSCCSSSSSRRSCSSSSSSSRRRSSHKAYCHVFHREPTLIAPMHFVRFPHVVASRCVKHHENTSRLLIKRKGKYLVTFSVYAAPLENPCNAIIGLELNDTILKDTQVTPVNGFQFIHTSIIRVEHRNTILRLRNLSRHHHIKLIHLPRRAPNANLTITKVS